jgi:DNA ligase-1
MPFKPLLAEAVDDINALRYPLLASVKYDGIRCVVINGVAMSRSLKPIPNRFVQSVVGKPEFNGMDGELMVNGNFQDVTSAFMSADGEPDFYFAVFDNVTNADCPFTRRYESLGDFPEHERIRIVEQVEVTHPGELREYYDMVLEDGHEGVMVRDPNGRYKHGRSTLKEGILLKWKPFADAEATVVGFEERMHNANEATTNALGRTERSSHKENLVPMDTLGALVVKNDALWPGQTFNIGTGFTDAQRAELWEVRNLPWIQSGPLGLIGRTVKFKYQAIGTKDVPRIPVFLGFRDGRDLS